MIWQIEGATSAKISLRPRCVLVLRHINERHGIQRVSRIGCSIGILGIVGITVIGYDNHFVTVGLSSLDGIARSTSIDSHEGAVLQRQKVVLVLAYERTKNNKIFSRTLDR